MTNREWLEIDIWQNGMVVASCGGTNHEAVRRDAAHYAMMYGQDGSNILIKESLGEPEDPDAALSPRA